MAGRISYYGNIVKDGLVLLLDAAKKDSYPGSGTLWRDVSGNGNNGTLINGPTFNSNNGGSIVFDGVNDSASLGAILNYTSENFSFNYWVYFNSLTTNVLNQGPIVFWKGSYQINGYYDQIRTSGEVVFVTNQSGVEQITQTTTNTIISNSWYNICYTRNSSSVRIYINGIDSNSISATHINPTSAPSNNFQLGLYTFRTASGGSNIPQIWGNFRLSCFSSYNRALTATEVLQNYNATKNRYL
jgi:hypothetical protein